MKEMGEDDEFMKFINDTVKEFVNEENLNKWAMVAKIIAYISGIALVGIGLYAIYYYIKIGPKYFGVEWEALLFFYFLGVFFYGILSLQFRLDLISGDKLVCIAYVAMFASSLGLIEIRENPELFLFSLIVIYVTARIVYRNERLIKEKMQKIKRK